MRIRMKIYADRIHIKIVRIWNTEILRAFISTFLSVSIPHYFNADLDPGQNLHADLTPDFVFPNIHL